MSLTILLYTFITILVGSVAALISWNLGSKRGSQRIEAVAGERDAARAETAELRNQLARREEQALAANKQATERQQELNELRLKHSELDKRLSDAEARREESARAAEERVRELKELREQFKGAFAELSNTALKESREAFLSQAKETFGRFNEVNAGELEKRKQAIETLVKPLGENLEKVSGRIEFIEKARVESFTQLDERIRTLMQNEALLRKETGALAEALRKPHVRGAWGEMQLRRVVEFAGMVDRCHFAEQVATGEGDRPDLVVSLPNGMQVIVDAKASMQAYLEALECDAEQRADKLKSHARQIRDRIRLLSQKKYAEQFQDAPAFVVLFLPAEALFSSALNTDSELLDYGMKNGIVLATPTTLISLLVAVSKGWQERQIAENARELKKLGDDLYRSVAKFLEHFGKLGRALDTAVKSYGESVGSLERTLLPKARKMNELGGFDNDTSKLDTHDQKETGVRFLRAPEAPEDEGKA